MQVISATEARANIFRLMEQVADCHEPLTITGKRVNTVMVSEEDWRGIQETIHLISIPGMAQSLLAAKHEPLDEGSESLPW